MSGSFSRNPLEYTIIRYCQQGDVHIDTDLFRWTFVTSHYVASDNSDNSDKLAIQSSQILQLPRQFPRMSLS